MMRRLWISIGIIAFLAALSTWHVCALNRYTTKLERQLELVQNYLNRENWEDAAPLLQSVYNQWEEKAFYLHTTLHHNDIDDIRASFREAMAFTQSRQDASECVSIIERLRNQLELLIEAELPTIKNLL